MHYLWIAMKAVLSAALLAVVGLLLLLFTQKTSDFALLGAAAIFLFMTAMLWIKLGQSSRESGLVGIVFGIGLLLVGVQPFVSSTPYPRDCMGKRLWCDIDNALHALGGPGLAAAPYLVLGVIVLHLSARVVVRHSLQR